jgi:hypothetical protein
MNIAHTPLPQHIVDQWLATTIRNAIKRTPQGRGIKHIEVDGEEVLLVYKNNEAFQYRAGPEVKKLADALRMDRIPEELGRIDLLPWGGGGNRISLLGFIQSYRQSYRQIIG